MTILLDESVPRALKVHLSGHSVKTVQDMGWTGLKNGELLKRAEESSIAVLITADRKLRFQQNLAARSLFVIVLPTNRVSDVLRLIPAIEKAIASSRPGGLIELPFPPDR